MKIKNIILGGLGVLALTACNDYLDVDAASTSATPENIYSNETEVKTALNGVYTKILSGSTFGNTLYNGMMLNSDVDFSTNSSNTFSGNSPKRFDMRTDAKSTKDLWNALYSGVEEANEFIYFLGKSGLYSEDSVTTQTGDVIYTVTPYTQMMGEAKVMRAMFYHELLSYYGDVPFSMKSTYETNQPLLPVADRLTISNELINDLCKAAEYMNSDAAISDAPRRISKEAAYAMIARLALQAGGYSLQPDAANAYGVMKRPDNYKMYYQIAMDYAKKVKDHSSHSLKKSFVEVFVNECKGQTDKDDDIIFELPFTKEQNGSWGYAQGPKSDVDAEADPLYGNAAWGTTNGGVRVTHMYRYMFEEGDTRRDITCGLISFNNRGIPTIGNSYTLYNNKWSKLWNPAGYSATSKENTGIGFGYLRYADVLLMFAEAANEVNDGPTAEAFAAVNEVRHRAFGDDNHKVESYYQQLPGANDKEKFLNAVLNERKFEFAGENMRWKDLVRNNKYAETLYYTFCTYFALAESHGGTSPLMDYVSEHDGIVYDNIPTTLYYCSVDNYNNPYFPNEVLHDCYILNPFLPMAKPSPAKPAEYFAANGIELVPRTDREISGLSTSSNTQEFKTAETNWYNDNGTLKNEILYSLLGFISGDENNIIKVYENGNPRTITPGAGLNTATLPAVRYLLPYPQEAITRSNGAYTNKYGY